MSEASATCTHRQQEPFCAPQLSGAPFSLERAKISRASRLTSASGTFLPGSLEPNPQSWVPLRTQGLFRAMTTKNVSRYPRGTEDLGGGLPRTPASCVCDLRGARMCVGAQERAWGLTPMKGMNFWYESSSGLLAEKKHRSFRWVGQMSPTTTLGRLSGSAQARAPTRHTVPLPTSGFYCWGGGKLYLKSTCCEGLAGGW